MLNLITTKEGSDLELRCLDGDDSRKDELLGNCMIPGSELQSLPAEGDSAKRKFELPLLDTDGNQVVGTDDKGAVLEIVVKVVPLEKPKAPPAEVEAPPSEVEKPAVPPADVEKPNPRPPALDSTAESSFLSQQKVVERTPSDQSIPQTPKDKRKVEVTVISANHMPKTDMVGLCDPYVVLKYGGREAKTTIKKKTLDAAYNEVFELNLNPNTKNGDLEVTVFDWDIGKKDTVVGTAVVPAAVLRNAPASHAGEHVSVKMHDGKGHPVHGRDQMQTKVEIKLRMIVPHSEAPPKEEAGLPWKVAERKEREMAKLDESFRSDHGGSFREKDGKRKVEVVVVCARNLPKTDTFGHCDPFIVLAYGGKEVKTSVKSGKQHASWNESFVLNAVPEGEPGGDLE
eukprot:407272-Rhodomonas_salina.1